MTLWRRLFGGVARKPAATAGPAGVDLDWLNAPTLLDFDSLYQDCEAQQSGYRTAEPFPHIVLEQLLPAPAARSAVAVLPPPGDDAWRRSPDSSDLPIQQGVQLLDEPLDGRPVFQELVYELNSGTFIRYLEKLSGIDGLLADPKLVDGGIQLLQPGGSVAIHAEATSHPRIDLRRRIKLQLFLGGNPPPSEGGELELWSAERRQCARRLRPVPGRCLLMSTSARAYHGRPRPLPAAPPAGLVMLVLYYYSVGPVDEPCKPAKLADWAGSPDVELPEPE
jgi:hypothetical protein